jgi:hypothetical protein
MPIAVARGRAFVGETPIPLDGRAAPGYRFGLSKRKTKAWHNGAQTDRSHSHDTGAAQRSATAPRSADKNSSDPAGILRRCAERRGATISTFGRRRLA